MQFDPQDAPNSSSRKGLHLVGTALLIAGSALFGGLAVVLWNRKALSRLHQPAANLQKPSSLPDDEET
jgi:hypothetical protein